MYKKMIREEEFIRKDQAITIILNNKEVLLHLQK